MKLLHFRWLKFQDVIQFGICARTSSHSTYNWCSLNEFQFDWIILTSVFRFRWKAAEHRHSLCVKVNLKRSDSYSSFLSPYTITSRSHLSAVFLNTSEYNVESCLSHDFLRSQDIKISELKWWNEKYKNPWEENWLRCESSFFSGRSSSLLALYGMN